MENTRHPLEGLLDQREEQEAIKAAEKEAKRQRTQEQREQAKLKWPAIRAIMLEAIEETNTVLEARNRPERFIFMPHPQPWDSVATGCIRIAEHNKPPKLEIQLTITSEGAISLGSFSFKDFFITSPLGDATRSWWQEVLTHSYRIISSSN